MKERGAKKNTGIGTILYVVLIIAVAVLLLDGYSSRAEKRAEAERKERYEEAYQDGLRAGEKIAEERYKDGYSEGYMAACDEYGLDRGVITVECPVCHYTLEVDWQEEYVDDFWKD